VGSQRVLDWVPEGIGSSTKASRNQIFRLESL
jgi:hypothetical protein